MSFQAYVFMGICLSGQTSSGQTSSGQMSFWANVFLDKCHLGKCLYGQMSSGQMSPWENVVWANVWSYITIWLALSGQGCCHMYKKFPLVDIICLAAFSHSLPTHSIHPQQVYTPAWGANQTYCIKAPFYH
jgi:hypothetical protein